MYPTNQTQADNSLSSMLSGDNRYKTAMALSGIGSAMRGQDNSNTLESMLMLDVMRDEQDKEAEGRKRSNEILASIFGGSNTNVGTRNAGRTPGVYNPPPQSTAQRMGLDMGRTPEAQAASQNPSVTVGGKTYDMGRVSPWAGKEDIQRGIFAGESGGDYNALFGYSNRPGGQFADVQLTNMTAGEAAEFSSPSGPYGQWVKGQVGRVATPMGAYQIVGTTLRSAIDAGVVDPNEQMTPEVQDRVGRWIYDTQGTGAWEGYRGPQAGGQPVQTAQTGGITRDQVMMVLQDEYIDNATKQFVLGEFRAQQKGGGLTGKERYMNVDGVLYDVSGPQPVAVTQAKPDDSAAMQKISRIKQAYGVDDRTAVGIADGVLKVSRDPFTEQIQITNLATNETWLPSTGQQGATTQGQPEAQPAQTTQPAQPDQNDLTFGQPYEDAENAFGLEGMVRRGINNASDFVTGREVFPDTGQTQRDFDLLREDITQDLQSAYGQRLPSWALQAVRDLTPSAGGFQGQGAAQGKLRALGRKFEQELQAVEQSLAPQNRRGTSPEDWAKMESQRGALRRSLRKIQNALGGFAEGGTGNQTSSGVNWRVVE